MRRIAGYSFGALALALLLAGCLGQARAGTLRYGPADRSLPPGAQQGWSFDADPVGSSPAGIQGVSGTWTVRAEPDAPSPPNALCQSANARWPVVLLSNEVYTDLDLTVRFKPISGREDQAGGLVFRAQDGDTYFITRANALENNVRLYTMRADNRTQIATADRPVASGVWHELAVQARGDRIRVRYDGEWVIDQRDATFSAGRIGLWTKADSVTCFDDVFATAAE
jgi:hypothetical protein